MKEKRVIGFLLLLGLAVWGLVVFQLLSIPSLRQKISEREKDLSLLQQKGTRLAEALSSLRTLESNLEVVRTALPVADDVPTLVMQLEEIARESGLGVQHLGFGDGKATAPATEKEETEEKEAGGVKKVAVTMVVSGSYPSLQTFLRNLENASRLVNITSLRFSPSQEGGEEAELSITLGVEAYYLTAPEKTSLKAPLTLDLTSPDYIDLIRKVKALRVYRGEVSE